MNKYLEKLAGKLPKGYKDAIRGTVQSFRQKGDTGISPAVIATVHKQRSKLFREYSKDGDIKSKRFNRMVAVISRIIAKDHSKKAK